MHCLKTSSGFKIQIFIPSLIFIIIISLTGIFFPIPLKTSLNQAQSFIFQHFSWLYVLGTAFFLIFLFIILFSRLGNIKLGDSTATPEFSFLSWIAMLFAAGMGVGLMYFGTAEPILHKVSPITAEHIEQNALLYSIFHWGFHPWAIYGVTALALAYFSYCKKLPLSLRSTLHPILKEKIFGFIGDFIDILCILVTLFGLVTTLGFSSIQLNSGLFHLDLVNGIHFKYQAIIIIAVSIISTLSVLSGLQSGLKKLSELNILTALLLLLFVFLLGPTSQLIIALIDNINNYISNLSRLSLKTFFYEQEHFSWFTNWTILYWAWWLSWAPFVGLFIARISYGRTIREFILGVLLAPTAFSILWFTVFGNTAILIDAQNGILSALKDNHGLILFKFLDHFPLSTISTTLAIVSIALFFITSADSGMLVLNEFASAGQQRKPSPRHSLFWTISLISISLALLYTDGLAAIQSMNLIITLLFILLLIVICLSLSIALYKQDK